MSVSDSGHHLLFVGTYTKNGSRGIYSLRLDARTGTLSAPVLAAESGNPTFLAFSPDRRFLYAVRDTEALAAGFAVDGATGALAPLPVPPAPAARPPCHVAVDHTGRALLLAHYWSGYVAVLPIRADGTPGTPTILPHHGHSIHPERQASSHVHSATVSPDNRLVVVCDLGLDKIFLYRLDAAKAALTPGDPPFIVTAPGSGPRHSAFAPDGRHLFVLNELNNTLLAFAYDSGRRTLTLLDTVSTLPAGFFGESSAAEVRVHPNGKFIYGSNRGHDSLALFDFDSVTGKLTLRETFSCGGQGPRHFAFSPDGAWLVCALQSSDALTVFRVDAATGRLTRTGGTATVSTPVCVLFYD